MAPLHPPASLLEALGVVFAENGVDPRAWALGLARATPAVTLVPAFGLSAVPPATRLALGLTLGLCIAPALAGDVNGGGPFVVALVREAFVGLPVALLAALCVYVAAMAGGLVDDLCGGREARDVAGASGAIAAGRRAVRAARRDRIFGDGRNRARRGRAFFAAALGALFVTERREGVRRCRRAGVRAAWRCARCTM